MPEPWEFMLLALAAFRVWKLIGDDAVLDRPRTWALARGGEKLELFLVCPWCAGFWIAVGWWNYWLVWPHASLIVATPFALSAVVGLVGVRAEPED